MKIKTNTVLLSTAYFPPVSYFYYLLKFEVISLEQYETFPKQTFRNRCEIMSGNGKLSLSIPANKPHGNSTITKDILIANGENWQKNHWRAIQSAYLNSPYFEYYQDDLEIFFTNEFKNLIQLNLEITNCICDIIGIKKKIELTQSYEHKPDYTIDLRSVINPKQEFNKIHFPEYIQVFSSRLGYMANLSVLDLLFNLGPESLDYLRNLNGEGNQP